MIRPPPPGPHIPPSGPVARAEAPLRHSILVFPGFPLMAFSAVIEPLRAANLLSGRQIYDWSVVAEDPGPLQASCGLRITPDHEAGAAPDAERILICSGGNAEAVVATRSLSWLRRQARGRAALGAVADGAFFLARAGLLDGHACTLHWTSQPAFRETFPAIDMRQDLFVLDRNRLTASGGIGALDMMLALIAQDAGKDLSAAVAKWFVHSPLRQDVDRQPMDLRIRTGISDPVVLAAIRSMEEALDEPLQMPQLASGLGISADRLERAFHRQTGLAPAAYLRRLRLRHAADLLLHSQSRIDAVALSCGFLNPSSFTRAFRAEFGCTPREMRATRTRPAGPAPEDRCTRH